MKQSLGKSIVCVSKAKGPDIRHRGCAVLQTVQRHGVHSVAYGTVHYKEPLK